MSNPPTGAFSKLLSAIGENPDFIAFSAHLGAAFVALSFGVPIWVVVPLVLIKEYWIDLKYETNPPQTIPDSNLDALGYLAGIAAFYLNRIV